MKMKIISIFTGKKLSRYILYKIVVGEGLRNESKLAKRRLGLRVQISIIVARHFAELRGLRSGGSYLGHRISV